MAATTIYTGAVSGVSQTFTVPPAGRVSLTLKGDAREYGTYLQNVECLLQFSDTGELVTDDGAIVLDARHNAIELIHSGNFQLRVRNPDAVNITLTVE